MTILFIITTTIFFTAWILAQVCLHLREGELQYVEELLRRREESHRNTLKERTKALLALDLEKTKYSELKKSLSQVAEALKADRDVHFVYEHWMQRYAEQMQQAASEAAEPALSFVLDEFIAEYAPVESTEPEEPES